MFLCGVQHPSFTVGLIQLNCSGTIMGYLCSVDVNFQNRPFLGLMPCFVCYLVQAAHGDLVRLPDMIAVYTAHVSEGNDKLACAVAQYSYFGDSINSLFIRVLCWKTIQLNTEYLAFQSVPPLLKMTPVSILSQVWRTRSLFSICIWFRSVPITVTAENILNPLLAFEG